jgi:hypothetical protein
MKYKTFSIKVYKYKSKWRAKITRANGRVLKPMKNLDQSSAVEAMTKAMEMIDVVPISPNIERSPEKHWRCLRKADGDLALIRDL